MKTLIIFLVLSFTFLGCSGTPEISPEVCEVGAVVCDVSHTICETLPVPEVICVYLDLACLNLEILCDKNPNTVESEKAKENLKKATSKINDWLQSYKQEKASSDSLSFNNK